MLSEGRPGTDDRYSLKDGIRLLLLLHDLQNYARTKSNYRRASP